MEEIYAIDYNSSVYQFRTTANSSGPVRLDVVETGLVYINGVYGQPLSNNQLGLTLLTSDSHECVSFAFLLGKGVQRYKISVNMFAAQGINPSLRGIMSLPNQVRSFDRLLFLSKSLNESMQVNVVYSVHLPRFLQKRNTGAEPCVDVDNYDKVIWDNGLAKCIVNFNF
jgi:hypothetical protein